MRKKIKIICHVQQTAAELSAFMRSHIPEHLMNEYQIHMELIVGVRIQSGTVGACIIEGILRSFNWMIGLLLKHRFKAFYNPVPVFRCFHKSRKLVSLCAHCS